MVDTDGGGMFVVKFRGAGQGPKALVAELIVGLLARELDLAVPELARVDVDSAFGRAEPDPEIQDLLRASGGPNVGLRYLEAALNFDLAAAGHLVTADFAARVVWLDALVTNPDRSARNPNLMIWEGRPWLIDHGAALYAHHNWATVDEARALAPFAMIRDHVLPRAAEGLEEMDAAMAARLTDDALTRVLGCVPDELLAGPLSSGDFDTPEAARARYRDYLVHARTAGFLGVRLLTDPADLAPFLRGTDPELVSRYLRSWRGICEGAAEFGPVALAPPSERFHWLTAPRSDILQSSPVHAGLCDDPERVLEELYAEYVHARSDLRRSQSPAPARAAGASRPYSSPS